MLNLFGRRDFAEGAAMPGIVVDTSVIIDGRIADIAKAGFVPGRLLVPRFVLAELQNIADSSDAMRRSRGRRGLEVLNSLQSNSDVEVEIVEHDIPDIKEVDAKLVRLAKILGTHILTTDYNLNQVAQIEGVRVLNVNELSNAVRPVIIPGEQMMVKVVQLGKEKGQGVGYLPDGTMIVVDKGDKLIGQEVQTEITRVFQTVAGKMLFAAPISQTHRLVEAPRNPKPQAAVPAPNDTPLPNTQSPNRNANPRHRRGKPRFNVNSPAPQAAPAVASTERPGANIQNSKRPAPARRISPMQKLENSLMEMNGESSDRP